MNKDGINKAVILARGLGKRMQEENNWIHLDSKTQELVNKGIKGLISLDKEKTILDYSIERLINTGYSKICIVIGQEHSEFRKHYSEKKFEAEISFAIQEKPLGTADAVYSARNFVGKDSFIILNADNLHPENALKILQEQNGTNWFGIGYTKEGLIRESNLSEERICKQSVIVEDENGFLKRIIEKPKHPENYEVNGNLIIGMNAFRFTPEIFLACENIKPSIRGEYEITSAVQYGVDKLGMKMKIFHLNRGVFDLTSKKDILFLRTALKSLDKEKNGDSRI